MLHQDRSAILLLQAFSGIIEAPSMLAQQGDERMV
jgi:hypothetical protein